MSVMLRGGSGGVSLTDPREPSPGLLCFALLSVQPLVRGCCLRLLMATIFIHRGRIGLPVHGTHAYKNKEKPTEIGGANKS